MSPSPGPRRPTPRGLWRLALLFILNPRPPWWGQAWVWAVVGIVLLMLYGQGWIGHEAINTSRIVSWRWAPSGEWEWVRPGWEEPARLEFSGSIMLRRGVGREEWMAFAALAARGVPLPGQRTTARLRRDGWQRRIDEARSGGDSAELRLVPAYEMLRDGRLVATRVSLGGVLFTGVAVAGMLLLLLALVAWFLRASLLVGYRERLALASAARCPRCAYPLVGLGTGERTRGRCPECGVDVAADAEDAARELGRGP